MRTTLLTGLLVAAGVGGQAFGYDYDYTPNRANKLGVLQLSLANQYQLYWNGSSSVTKAGTFGVMTAPWTTKTYRWNDQSYRTLENCEGSVYYKSASGKVDNVRLIQAINAAMMAVDGTNVGLFINPSADNIWRGALGVKTTKLVIARYENEQQAPPYPPNMDVYWNGFVTDTNNPDVWQAQWYNAPWDSDITLATYGDMYQLQWPNKNANAWGKPRTLGDGSGIAWDYEIAPVISGDVARVGKPGMQVFAIDPKNVNPNLRCFDVTPFFTFEEGVCQYCWDTMDRVTDGIIQKASIVPGSLELPCQAPGPTPEEVCSVKGSGNTKFFLNIKFNNVSADRSININGAGNPLLANYYTVIMGGPELGLLTWGTPLAFGARLDAGDRTASVAALNFEVSGVTTYAWAYKPVAISSIFKVTEAMGKMSLTAQGHGWSPMCGILTGPVTITEVGALDASFGGQATCVNGNFPK